MNNEEGEGNHGQQVGGKDVYQARRKETQRNQAVICTVTLETESKASYRVQAALCIITIKKAGCQARALAPSRSKARLEDQPQWLLPIDAERGHFARKSSPSAAPLVKLLALPAIQRAWALRRTGAVPGPSPDTGQGTESIRCRFGRSRGRRWRAVRRDPSSPLSQI